VSSAQVPTILNAFIPGYTFFCKLVHDNFGIDVSDVAFVFFALVASGIGIRYLVSGLGSQFLRHFTAAVTVDSNDFVYDCLLDWAADHPALGGMVRSLHVRSIVKQSLSAETVDSSSIAAHDSADEMLSRNGKSSAAEKMARPNVHLQYDIYRGAHWFRHNGRFYRLAREDQLGSGENWEKLTLTVLGRSTQPIKALITEALERGISKHVRKGGRWL
jgi:hypothetical protein